MSQRTTASVPVTFRCGCVSAWETTIHDWMRAEDIERVKADLIKRAGQRHCGPCASRLFWGAAL